MIIWCWKAAREFNTTHKTAEWKMSRRCHVWVVVQDSCTKLDVYISCPFICVLQHQITMATSSDFCNCSHYLRDDLTVRSFTFTAESLMEDQDRIHLLRFLKTSTRVYTVQDNRHHENGTHFDQIWCKYYFLWRWKLFLFNFFFINENASTFWVDLYIFCTYPPIAHRKKAMFWQHTCRF